MPKRKSNSAPGGPSDSRFRSAYSVDSGVEECACEDGAKREREREGGRERERERDGERKRERKSSQ